MVDLEAFPSPCNSEVTKNLHTADKTSSRRTFAQHGCTVGATAMDAEAGIAFAEHAGAAGATAVDADVSGAPTVGAEAAFAFSEHACKVGAAAVDADNIGAHAFHAKT